MPKYTGNLNNMDFSNKAKDVKSTKQLSGGSLDAPGWFAKNEQKENSVPAPPKSNLGGKNTGGG